MKPETSPIRLELFPKAGRLLYLMAASELESINDQEQKELKDWLLEDKVHTDLFNNTIYLTSFLEFVSILDRLNVAVSFKKPSGPMG